MTASNVDTHPCPGCGKEGIADEMLACYECWKKVPKNTQREVYRTFGSRRRAPTDMLKVRAHQGAMADAISYMTRP